jgi:hypothetical protein
MYPSGYRANPQGPQAWRHNLSRKGSVEARLKVTSWLDWRSSYYESDGEVSSAIVSSFRPTGGLVLSRTRGAEPRASQTRRHFP